MYTGRVRTLSALVVVRTPAVFVLSRRSLWSVHRPRSYFLGAHCGLCTGRVRTLSALVVVRNHTGRFRTLSVLVVVLTPAVFVLSRCSLWSLHRPCSYSLGARCGPYTIPAVFVLSRRSFGARQRVAAALWRCGDCGGVETLEVWRLMHA